MAFEQIAVWCHQSPTCTYIWERSCSSLASGPLRDYCDWIGMVRKLAQIAGLAQETARGWWEIKTSLNANCHREEDTEREHGGERLWEGGVLPLLILMLARSCPTHTLCFRARILFYDIFECHILLPFYLSLSVYHLLFIHEKGMLSWTMQCAALINCLEASDVLHPETAQGQYTLHIPEHAVRTERQRSQQQAGWEVNKVKLGWITVHDREKEWEGRFARCCFNKLVRSLCWIISFLCASTNEIRPLIILTLSKGYNWGFCYLNHIYVPIPASVCSPGNTHYIRLLTVYMLQLHMVL